jgi:hypothetical protein
MDCNKAKIVISDVKSMRRLNGVFLDIIYECIYIYNNKIEIVNIGYM